MRVLDADADAHRLCVGHLTEQAQQHNLLFECLEHRADRTGKVERGGARKVRRTSQDHPLLRTLDQRLQHRRQNRDCIATLVGRDRVGQVGEKRRRVGQMTSCNAIVEPGAQICERILRQRARQVDDPLLHATGVGDEYDEDAGLRRAHQLEVADGRARQRRVLHDGDLMRQLREQPNGAMHDVVEIHRAAQKRVDRLAFRRRQRLDRRQSVDEQAVALVGGHSPGRRVWLRDVAVVFERGHVIADRGR